MSNQHEIRMQLKEWIAAKHDDLEAASIPDDKALIPSGMLTSLQLMEFILFLEELSNQAISIEDLKPGSFKDINTIMEGFFARRA